MSSSHPTSYVVLPDEENAYLLKECFVRLGLRLPSFLFRVYLLYTEFSLYSERSALRYPVTPSLEFILHVCNGRDPNYRGIDRCVDIEQALFSLLSKGHHLNSSSLLLLYGQDQTSGSWSEESNRRHRSLDATEGEFVPSLLQSSYSGLNSLHLRSPGLESHRPLSESRVPDGLLGYPRIQSQTPLLRPNSLLETPHLSEDESMPEFHLSRGSDEYRFGNLFTFHEDRDASSLLTSNLPTRAISTRHGSEPISFTLSSSVLNPQGSLWEESRNPGDESFINPSWTMGSTSSINHGSIDSTSSHSTGRGLLGPMEMSTRVSTTDGTEERRRANSISFVPSGGFRRNQASPLSMQARTPVLQARSPTLAARTPTLQGRFGNNGAMSFGENGNEYSLGRGNAGSHMNLGVGDSGSDFVLTGDPNMSSEFKLEEGFGVHPSYSSLEYYSNNKTLRRSGGGNSVLNPNCAEFIPQSHHQSSFDKSSQPERTVQEEKGSQHEKGSRDLLVGIERECDG